MTLLAGAGLFVFLGAGLAIAGVVNILRNPAGGLVLLVAAAVIFALAELLRRSARPDRSDPLTLVVGSDGVSFERQGQLVDHLGRAEVGVVVLEGFGRAGVLTVTVRAVDGALVGRWDTGWVGRSVLRPWQALRRYGWPRAIEEHGKVRKVSKDAPPWVRKGQGCDAAVTR